jgi:hypothetical protein
MTPLSPKSITRASQTPAMGELDKPLKNPPTPALNAGGVERRRARLTFVAVEKLPEDC